MPCGLAGMEKEVIFVLKFQNGVTPRSHVDDDVTPLQLQAIFAAHAGKWFASSKEDPEAARDQAPEVQRHLERWLKESNIEGLDCSDLATGFPSCLLKVHKRKAQKTHDEVLC